MGDAVEDDETAVRVDRATVLGNPYCHGARGAVCDAFDALLRATMESADGDVSVARVEEIGREAGVPIGGGCPRPWNGGGAKAAVKRLRGLAREQNLVLCCNCAPKACHAESIRDALMVCGECAQTA